VHQILHGTRILQDLLRASHVVMRRRTIGHTGIMGWVGLRVLRACLPGGTQLWVLAGLTVRVGRVELKRSRGRSQ
jgi:hypothetical protein